ncbi:helix-turn-helix transcriptional regulator [Sphingobacterium faecale]|uniref:HTH luxR-type domain-containing protein n=1 Tax=Sphingobacterium faecale TaxID=2803775 RepID=A0ABS1QXW8_9SPHI|nr:hypothetical protein [Sphingobacterium faecale]MBL1407283.1 hypothetical protein [Sphingobacterium faecale]
MNILSTRLVLLLFLSFLFFPCGSAKGIDYVIHAGSVESKKNNPRNGSVIQEVIITSQNAFDFLLDVDRNKELLRAAEYRTTLAQSLINYGKIKELVMMDSYLFKEMGIDKYLSEVLEESTKLALTLPDSNQQRFYSCLIDASNAGLKIPLDDQRLLYTRAYKHYASIDESAKEFKMAKSIGQASQALSLFLSQHVAQAREVFLKAISDIDERNIEEADYYLVFRYINFLAQTKANDDIEKWLKYALSLAREEGNIFYQALSYYHFVLLKVQQGLPDTSAKYLREYQLCKVALSAKELVRISFVESGYYDFSSISLVKKDKGIATFFGLVLLIVAGTIGASAYVYNASKKEKLSIVKRITLDDPIALPDDSQKVVDLSPNNIVGNEMNWKRDAAGVEYISNLKKMAENNDPLFMQKFKQFFRDFAEYVGKEAETPLNLAELEVCAYTKLGYTTKEVAYYRGDSIRSVENRKYRIRRKLNLPRDVDFTNWVLTA